MTRKITAVTSSRADYSHLHYPLKALQNHPDIDLRIIAFAAHLSHEFGHTINEITADQLTVHHQVETLLSSDSDAGMAKSIGLATLSLTDILAQNRPDILLIIADRYEMLAPASVALALRIPIAHIEGGDISEGAIDNAVRNALTMMAHIHLAPTQHAADRIKQMGEEPWRIHNIGAPSLDFLTHNPPLSKSELEKKLEFNLNTPPILIAYHPVTLHTNTTAEADHLFNALTQLNHPLIFCFPNADAGSRNLIARATLFTNSHTSAKLYTNLDTHTYLSLLHHAALLLGNSSSGIMETPSIPLPTVNIGDRQKGRTRAPNIIDTPADTQQILNTVNKALSPEFHNAIQDITNPYGNGTASQKITEILTSIQLDEKLLQKKSTIP